MDAEVKRYELLIESLQASIEKDQSQLNFLEESIEIRKTVLNEYIQELADYVSKDVETARKYLESEGIPHEKLWKKFAIKLDKLLKK